MSCALLSLPALLAHCIGREELSFDRVLIIICRLDGGYASTRAAVHIVGLLRLKPPLPGPTLMSRVQRLRPRGTASRIDLPCRSASPVRAAKRRRMGGEHLANDAMCLHPLYSCCAAIMASDGGEAALRKN